MKLKLNKKQRGMVFMSFFAIIIIVLSYTLILPRVQVESTTVYHMSFSGISVQTKVENKGTYDLADFKVNLSVVKEENGELMGYETVNVKLFEPRTEPLKLGFTFEGPAMKLYIVTLALNFESEGLDYNESYEYEIKDYMNNAWDEKLTDWRI